MTDLSCVVVEGGEVLNDPPNVDVIDLDGIEDVEDETLHVMLQTVQSYLNRSPEDDVLRYAKKAIINEIDWRVEMGA